jgi:hypothetical protein
MTLLAKMRIMHVMCNVGQDVDPFKYSNVGDLLTIVVRISPIARTCMFIIRFHLRVKKALPKKFPDA